MYRIGPLAKVRISGVLQKVSGWFVKVSKSRLVSNLSLKTCLLQSYLGTRHHFLNETEGRLKVNTAHLTLQSLVHQKLILHTKLRVYKKS